MINSQIFKAYDIRGIYPEEINEEAAYLVGRAFIKFLTKRGLTRMGTQIDAEIKHKRKIKLKIVVGRDARVSSPKLAKFLMKGFLEEGAAVIDIGLVSTPAYYFAINHFKSDGGAMITASHNPAKYNGLKLCLKDAVAIGAESGLMGIKNTADELGIKNKELRMKKSKVLRKDILNEYIKFVFKKVDLREIKPLKIAIDCGNGMIGPEIKKVIAKLPCKTKILYANLDGRFPNHEANPSKEETLKDLKVAVLKYGADLGVAFDGDADRAGFVSEKGESVRGDFITALLAKELLKECPKQGIVYEIRSSWIVPEIIKESGGASILSRAGHTLIKDKMRKENALFGGELSGHYFFRDLGFIDNALLAMLKILEIASQAGKPFSRIIEPLAKYFQSGEINFKVENKDKKIKEVEEKYKTAAKNIFYVDGMTAEFDSPAGKWWFNLRPSNTESLLRLNMEAENKELLEEKKKELIEMLNKR